MTTTGWTGIYSLSSNPGVADSKNYIDVNLGAVDFSYATNLSGVDGNGIWKLKSGWFSPSLTEFKEVGLGANSNFELSDETFSTFKQAHFQGPSFLYGITDDRWKHTVGFSANVHVLENYRNMDVNFAQFMSIMNSNPTASDLSVFGKEYDFKPGSITAAAWADYSLSYSAVIVDSKQHKFKAGFSIKLLQGLGASTLQIDDLTYLQGENSNDIALTGNITHGESDDRWIDTDRQGAFNFKFNYANPTVGFDIGVVYEFQANKDRMMYDMDGQTGLLRKDRELNTFSLGVAFTDIGSFNYSNTGSLTDYGSIFHLTTVNQLNSDIQSGNETALEALQASGTATEQDEFKVGLPTRFNGYIDGQPYDGVHITFSAVASINSKNAQVRYPNRIGLAVRYERPWYGVALPFTYLPDINSFGVGLQLRAGPVFIGTDNLINIAGASPNGTFGSIYAGVRVVVPHMKPKDRDGDKVSDKVDLCKDYAGPWESRGCPDKDGDLVWDFKDDCPDIAGDPRHNGCPDSDYDDIIDSEDECDTIPGLKEFAGCPDDDKDGVPDHIDQCVGLKGLAEFYGCPDTDEDGIIDPEDECPEIFGYKSANGCPDDDLDGVKNSLDICPGSSSGARVNENGCEDIDRDGGYEFTLNENGEIVQEDLDNYEAGPAKCGYIPCPDSDDDGVIDLDDLCPDEPGPEENRGCPYRQVKKRKSVMSRQLMLSIPFGFTQFNLQAVDEADLDQIIEEIKLGGAYGELKSASFIVVGLADESEPLADDIAEQRAYSVFSYMVDNGIPADRIKQEDRVANAEDKKTKAAILYFFYNE